MSDRSASIGPKVAESTLVMPPETLFSFWLDGPSLAPTGQVWAASVTRAWQKVMDAYGKRPYAILTAPNWESLAFDLDCDKYNAKMRKSWKRKARRAAR